MSNSGRYQIIRGYDKRVHKPFFCVVVTGLRLESRDFDHLKAICKDCGGWWSKPFEYNPMGFAFKHQNPARRFAIDYIETIPLEPSEIR